MILGIFCKEEVMDNVLILRPEHQNSTGQLAVEPYVLSYRQDQSEKALKHNIAKKGALQTQS